jgi:hypothetical protein
MKQMRPLPFAPDSTILETADTPTGYVQRLELWNRDPQRDDVLDYVVLAVAPEEGGEPTTMVSTRPARHPDPELEDTEGPARLVPAARQSILTIPLEQSLPDWPYRGGDVTLAEQLLDALAADRPPWREAEVEVDRTPQSFRVLTWPGGALWAGEYKDVTVSVIGDGEQPRVLRLRSLDSSSVARLTDVRRE